MENPTKKLSLYMIFFIIGVQFIHSEAMQYQEPLNVEDLNDLFSEDGCIEGTLSVTETGGPIIKSVSFTESEHSSILKSTSKNKTDNFDDKSPMSLISELAQFNKIKHNYILTGEEGPPHKKLFLITLMLGDETYNTQGSSIKKAQQESAKMAMLKTSYKYPPNKPKKVTILKYDSTPEQKLNAWAGKHGDSTVTYSYIQQSKFGCTDHNNNFHKGMYSKAENIHKVTVKVNNQEFIGEGISSYAAKQKAASYALKNLQHAEGFCMFDDSLKSVFNRLFTYNTNYSPISLIHEFASKSLISVTFDLVSEEGPPHIKKFVYKCSIGNDFETFGEGSSKKVAKTEAAENMIQTLKSHSSYKAINCGTYVKSKKQKKKSRNLIKSVVNSFPEDETNFEPPITDDINPISKLFQIQQKRHDVEPIFRLIEEKGQTNKEFFMEVTVRELSFVGSGPNKKAAKRNAAQGILEKLGYSTTASGKIRVSFPENKKKEFVTDHATLKKKPLVPGLNINSERVLKHDNSQSSTSFQKDSTNAEHTSDTSNSKKNLKDNSMKSENKKSDTVPKMELKNLAQQLGFRFQFSDFPKGNTTGFVSLVSLTTNPPKVCFGTGETSEKSQNKAALSALKTLYKNQLSNISQMLKETFDSPIKKGFYGIDEKTVIKTIINKETE